jgi:hypothetical protein
MIQYFPIVTGSLTVLGNINVSGSITTSGSITISGSITSASFASTASFVANAESASYVLTAQTASFVALAQSASNAVSAVTASFANNLTVAGTLTAQTLVVQTITSSVDFVTGSTRFGSIAANTHVFTGSVLITGSITATEGNFLGSGVDGSLGSVVRISTTNTNGNARNWALVNTFDSYGDLNFRISTAQGGNALVSGSTILTLSRIGAATLNGTLQVTTTSYNGITITTNDVATLKMTNSGGTTKNWGFATTNTAASDFGIYQSTSNGGDSINAGTSRLYFNGAGYTKISNNGTYEYVSAAVHEIRQSAADYILYATNNNASPNGHYISYTTASPNGTGNPFLVCSDSTATRFTMRSNGGLANYSANNTNLSDERTKKDIIPLESYWDKFKNIEIVKFKYKDQTHDDFNIGVIAQQVESIAPEFVDVDGFGETPEDGIPLKSIYEADLHHTTIKVLQEAMAKIETLQAEFEEYKATHP